MLKPITAVCYVITIAIVTMLGLTGIVYAAETKMHKPAVSADGIVRVKSAHGFDTTVELLKKDVETKGIKFFDAIDQSQLGSSAGIKINRSTLLIFGNPPLGVQFLTANPNAGLDWPVRLLVTEDNTGQVWAVYTDFGWIARRHRITTRDPQFKMASEVIASITSSVAKK